MNNSEFAVYIGIDWADQENVCRLLDPVSKNEESFCIKQTPEALSEWTLQIRKRFPDGKIAIALEQFRGALAFFLMQFEFIVLYMINPKALAKFREAFRVSGAKDDPDDAKALLNLIVHHREKFRPWLPDDPQTRRLRILTEQRRELVDRRTAITNKVTSFLKCYFPQALSLTGSLSHKMAHDFLKKWPNLQRVKKARPSTIREFYLKHHCRRSDLIETRISEIQHASPITMDATIIESYQLLVELNMTEVHALTKGIEKLDSQIESIYAQHPDRDIFASFPGAGATTAPRLLAAIGSNRDRYESCIDMQQYSGIAPVRRQSGRTAVVARRIARPIFVAQSFHEFALRSIPLCAWAHAYYDSQRLRGKSHHAAVRALAFKWIRIIFQCWKQRTLYDEKRYLDALLQRKSPLISMIKSA